VVRPSEWDCESECRSPAEFGFDPDPAAIPLHDSVTNGQTDPGSGVVVGGMETFEEPKNNLFVLWRYTDTVVGNRELIATGLPLTSDMHGQLSIGIAILEGVCDQILQNLKEVGCFHRYQRKRI